MNQITLKLEGNSYDIHIGGGFLEEVGHFLLTHDFRRKSVIITDEVVNGLYGDRLEKSLNNWGLKTSRLVIPAGEEHKNLGSVGKLYTRMAEEFADRQTPVIALGGGVIGDLAGFVAATYMRGVPLVQIPTTLVAQVDSSLGGKTAVDHENLKNIIGVFYQPLLTVSDISVLSSLPERRIKDGLAEIIKYGIILDKIFFEYLEKNIERIKKLEEKPLEYAVTRSVELKAGIVEKDEKDTGVRNILNFGHTIGHALESVSGFSISHGEAVSIGMVGAAKASLSRKMIDKDEYTRIVALLEKAGLPTAFPRVNINSIIETIKHDKKAVDGNIRFITVLKLGDPVISDDIGIKTIDEVLHHWNEQT